MQRYITSLILFICFFVSLLTLQEHVLYYQEQHNLFLFTSEYFYNTLHWEGLNKYIGSFFVQFYYYPWLGAGIISLMLAGIYFMIESIIKRFTGHDDIFQIGAIIAIALYFTLDDTGESPVWVVISFFTILFLFVCGVILFKNKSKIENSFRPKKIAISSSLIILYCFGAFLIEMSSYDRDERSMLRAERAIKQQDWDSAVNITSRYLSTGKSNRLMLYLRNIALAKKGELVDHLFDFPQKLGIKSLAFPWTRNSRETEHGHWVHEITGDINAAHFWAFEGMTVWGETAHYLSTLGHYNVALGRNDVALKFADKLKKSLFYKKEAEVIEKEILNGGTKPGLYYALPDSIEVEWLNYIDFRPNLLQNFKADPQNPIGRQYLIAAMLLSNSIRELLPFLNSEDLKSKTIREALVQYDMESSGSLENYNLQIDPSLKDNYQRFNKLYLEGNKNALIKEFAPTFWFYRSFLFDPKNP